MTSGHRDRLLLQFRNLTDSKRGLLSNARCLAEGVDVPSIDAVAFIDPKHSTVDIIQAVGRAIRKSPDKRIGTIVVPVFLGGDDPERALNDSSFRSVWDILKALRAHDETLGEELDEIRRTLGALGSRPRRPGKIKLDVPAEWVGAAFANAFNTRLVEATTRSWEFWFGLLERYAAREGDSRPKAAHREDGFGLGGWVTNQLQLRRNGRLRNDYAARLEALPGWTWALYDTWWERNLELLEGFAEREGHASPVGTHVEQGAKLGQWVTNQRQALKRGKLSTAQRSQLEVIPGWRWEVIEEAWERGMTLLRRYVDRELNALVPQKHVEEGLRLGTWVTEQRQNKREGVLSPERQAKLEAIPGWAWDKHQAIWQAHYAALEHFAAREGHANPAQKHVEGNLNLGGWLANQRNRTDSLNDTQRSQLEALPGWSWRPRDEGWEQASAALRQYVTREGNSLVPTGHSEDGFALGRWVAKRRGLYRAGGLPAEQARWLESQRGWTWEPRSDAWEQGFEALARYTQQHGTAAPALMSSFEGFRLGSWANVQRTSYERGKLGQERRSRLESLPGWMWDPHADLWERSFSVLERYSRRVGDASPPKGTLEDGLPIAQWVSVQRAAHKRGKLDRERTRRLEALPGWVWDANETAWREKFELLRAIASETGDANLRFDQVVDGVALGSWIDVQRRYYRTDKLREDRKTLLEDLPGWEWDARGAAWDKRYRALERYVAETGHAAPPSSTQINGVPVGQWVTNLRQSHRNGRLSAQRAQALELLPGWRWATRSL